MWQVDQIGIVTPRLFKLENCMESKGKGPNWSAALIWKLEAKPPGGLMGVLDTASVSGVAMMLSTAVRTELGGLLPRLNGPR